MRYPRVHAEDMLPLLLDTLGRCSLRTPAGEPITSVRHRELAILAYLARRGDRPLSREELATVFWGERDEAKAKISLRQALHRLRPALADRLEVDGTSVGLVPGSVTLDASEFEDDLDNGRFAQAVEHWHGLFLPGAEDVGDGGFRSWLETERAALGERYVAALERLASEAASREQWSLLGLYAERWHTVAPVDERAFLLLNEALHGEGKLAEAATRRREFVTSVRRELHRDPSDAVMRADIARIQYTTPLPRRARPAAVLTPELIGRRAELGTLVTLWTAVREQPGAVVLIEGEAGIGKSRLVRALLHEIAIRQDRVVLLQARATDRDRSRSLSTVSRMLAPLRDAIGLGGASERALAAVSLIVPTLHERFTQLPPHSGDLESLGDAVAEVVGVVAEETPVLVIVDDFDRADADTQRVILSVADRVPRSVIIVLTAATESWLGGRVLRGADGPAMERLKLRPLSESETNALIASMIALAPDARGQLSTSVHRQSEGVPFYTVELVSALADVGALTLESNGRWSLSGEFADGTLPIPVGVRSAIQRRLDELTPAARCLVNALAVVGRDSNAALVESVSGLAPNEFTAAMHELIARRLICASQALDAPYELNHDLVARAAYELIPPTTKCELHTVAARSLAREPKIDAKRYAFHHVRGSSGFVSRVTDSWPRYWRHAAATIAAGLVIAATTLPGTRNAKAELASSPRRVAVASFENESGDSRIDGLGNIVADWLTNGVARTGLARVSQPISNARTTDSQSTAAVQTRVHSLARGHRADIVVSGGYYIARDSLRFHAYITNVRTGERLGGVTPVSGPRDAPLIGVERLRQQVLASLAPWIDDRLTAAARVQSTPPSYAAYVAFAEGLDHFYARDAKSADYFARAYALDTTFTLPLLYEALQRNGIAHYSTADSLLKRLAPRRVHLAPYDRLLFDILAASLRGDAPAAYEAARAAALLAPGSFAATMLPGATLSYNRPREALKLLLPADSTSGEPSRLASYWTMVASAQHLVGEFEDELETGSLVRRHFAFDPRYLHYEARSHAALGRLGALDTLLVESLQWRSIPGWGPPGLRVHLTASDELRAHGQIEASRSVLERALRYYDPARMEAGASRRHRIDVARALH